MNGVAGLIGCARRVGGHAEGSHEFAENASVLQCRLRHEKLGIQSRRRKVFLSRYSPVAAIDNADVDEPPRSRSRSCCWRTSDVRFCQIRRRREGRSPCGLLLVDLISGRDPGRQTAGMMIFPIGLEVCYVDAIAHVVRDGSVPRQRAAIRRGLLLRLSWHCNCYQRRNSAGSPASRCPLGWDRRGCN